MDFFHDKAGSLCIKAAKYITKMMDIYTCQFGVPHSHRVHLPAEANHHSQLDVVELFDMEGMQQYQSLIGMLQWIISIGHFDVHTAIMTLSSFCTCPLQGHPDRAKCILDTLENLIMQQSELVTTSQTTVAYQSNILIGPHPYVVIVRKFSLLLHFLMYQFY